MIQQIIPAASGFPNNPHLPLLLYTNVLKTTDPKSIQALFASNGWKHSWVNGIFPFHHFHSNTHEVLGIASGNCQVQIGGPSGKIFTVNNGDVILIPAGVAHKNEGNSADFLCIGAYPFDTHYDMCSGDEQKLDLRKKIIAQVPLPKTDPVHGKEGPLFQYWKEVGDRT